MSDFDREVLMMGKTVKRELLLATAAAVMILMIPVMMAAIGVRVPGIETAHAGGGTDLSSVAIDGICPDGKFFNGQTISVSADDLGKAYSMSGGDFLTKVNNGEIEVFFEAAAFDQSDTSFMNPISEWMKLDTTLSGNNFTCDIPTSYYPQDGQMIGIQLLTKGQDSYYSNNSKTYGVKSRFVTKSALDTSSLTYYPYADHVEFTNINLSSLGEYYAYPDSTSTVTAYNSVIRFYKGSTLVASTMSTSMYGISIDVPVSYGANEFTVALYSKVDGKDYFAEAWTITVNSAGLPKNTVYATKISANKAIVRWTGSSGASGYYVYMGSKKVKTVDASTRKVTISKKGAGKAKYKVIPYIDSGSIVKGESTVMKAKANVLSRNIPTGYKSYDYGKGQFVVKKISGSGKKYTLTCYAINNRMFKLKKYKKIKITVYADGKKIISKTIKNKKVNVKKYGSKKVKLKIKGKEGDLKHGTVSVSVSYTPYWGKGISSF